MCPEGCGAKVKEILAEQPGAKEVLVEFETKTVTVAVVKEKFDSQKALAALVDHQFGQSAVKDAAPEKAVAKSPLGRVFDPEAQTRRELGTERQAADAAAVQ
jgi:copper chaperone CopZ